MGDKSFFFFDLKGFVIWPSVHRSNKQGAINVFQQASTFEIGFF